MRPRGMDMVPLQFEPDSSPRRPVPHGLWFVIVGGGLAVLVLLVALVVRPAPPPVVGAGSPAPPSTAPGSASPSPPASPSAGFTPSGSQPAPTPPAAPTAPPVAGTATLPVRRDAGEIRLAPGPDGGLYVSIADDQTHVVALLGADGAARPGWPIRVPASWCVDLLGAEDGSVILACDGSDPGIDGLEEPKVRLFRFDDRGRQARGWPVEFAGEVWRLEPRIVGDELAVLIHPYMGDAPPEVPREVFLGLIDPGGTLRSGSVADYTCCDVQFATGPDGTGYILERTWAGSVSTVISAFRLEGLVPSWPITVASHASRPGFDDEGRIYFAFGELGASPTRLLVVDRGGRALPLSTEELPIPLTSSWSGAGEDFPSAPIVGAAGTTFIVAEPGGTRVVAVADGSMLPGFPFESSAEVEDAGRCGNEDTGCGVFRVEPVVDNADILYIAQAATSSSVGGRIIALNDRGQIVDGWPVTLTRPGGYFTLIVPAPRGVWALALEPEGNGSSATVLSIAPDSTVRWTTTVAEP